jgi:hypothetical protein
MLTWSKSIGTPPLGGHSFPANCISCRRLMTLIIDNLTKGNRKNIESALIGGQLNAMVRY